MPPQKVPVSGTSKDLLEHLPTDLGLIGTDFDYGTDNISLSMATLSKWQRRRRAKRARARYKVRPILECEEIVPRAPINNCKNIMWLSKPEKQHNLNYVTSRNRILDPSKKNDLIKLQKMKRNLETLKTISNSENSGALQVYKELPNEEIDLRCEETVEIPSHEKVLIRVKPQRHSKNKLWLAKIDKTLDRASDLHMPQTIVNDITLNKKCLCLLNLSKTTLIIKKGDRVAKAKEIFYSSIPMMDAQLVEEIDRATDTAPTEPSPATSQREEAERDFTAALSEITNHDLKKLILEYKSLFIPSSDWELDKIKIPPIELGTIHREIKPTPPLARRHFSDKFDKAISDHIEMGLLNGLIQRQQSPTVSPLHAVEQNGKIRIVMDSRKVNEQIELYNYIFPKLDQEIESLASGKYRVFSQTDLTGAFNQIEVHKNSRFLLAFAANTKRFRGTFAYTRLPFGIKSSPAIFASILDRVLEQINDPDDDGFIIKSFIDDIVCGAKDNAYMLKALRLLFARLNQFNMKLRLSKSHFMSEKNHVLWHRSEQRWLPHFE